MENSCLRIAAPADMSTPPHVRRVLAVGLAQGTLDALPRHVLFPSAQVLRAGFRDLSGLALTGPAAPALVLTPLVAGDFDCVEMACQLARLGYRGRYLALTPTLPDAGLVRAEVETMAPAVDFDLVLLAARPALRLV